MLTAGRQRGRVDAISATLRAPTLGSGPAAREPLPESADVAQGRKPQQQRLRSAASGVVGQAALGLRSLPPATRATLRAIRGRQRTEALVLVLLLCLALSAFIAPSRFQLTSASDQAIVETTATLISTVAAALFAGRFWRHLRLRDLLLAVGLAVIAASNLGADLLLAGSLVIAGHSGAWVVIGGRLAGWLLIAGSAVVRDRRLRRPTEGELRLIFAAVGALAAFAAIVVALDAHVTAYEALHDGPLGNPTATLVAQILLALVTAFAAVAFRREASLHDSPPAQLLALACAFAAAAALAACAAPTVYASRVGISDVLRLGWLVALFACVCVEWSLDERHASANALARERRRVAADVHDLIMQDLSFALAGARALADDPGRAREASTVVSAGERALAGARGVVSALTEQSKQPIGRALESSVRVAARHTPLTFDAGASEEAPQADEATRNALVHIGREAVTNAVKHARASAIAVVLAHDDEWRLTVRDDGCGFGPDRRARGADGGPAGDTGGFGLASMRHHAETLGGSLRVHSDGRGTTVEVSLP